MRKWNRKSGPGKGNFVHNRVAMHQRLARIYYNGRGCMISLIGAASRQDEVRQHSCLCGKMVNR
jgi:hypothetical protein